MLRDLQSFLKMASLQSSYNCVVLLGPTAVGKTALGVRIADFLEGEIVSADSRQVYKGLDIGSGKDLAEYEFRGRTVPYHLIDIANLSCEYSVFLYQQDFYKVFKSILEKGKIPVIVGGTGMYLDAVIRNYDLIPVPENKEFREWAKDVPLEELGKMLLELKGGSLHVMRDLLERERVIKAIEIEKFIQSPECEEFKKSLEARPEICPLVLGTTLERATLRANIKKRLYERLDSGMIEEVERLHSEGASWERLEKLGLEYRFVSEFLEGKFSSKEEMAEKLNIAIGQFAKRQETWFRGMEKNGVKINWLPKIPDLDARFAAARKFLEDANFS